METSQETVVCASLGENGEKMFKSSRPGESNMKVLILSMGKAGSTTVINALKSAGVAYGRMHWSNRHEVDPNDYTHFIAMAREPVARSISDYFESGVDIKIGIAQTLAFFDELVKPVTGVDIYQWPPIKAWLNIGSKFLVIKTERLDTLACGLSAILPLPVGSFTVTHHPKGSERFGPEYDEFKESFRLPREYLEKVACHKYCQLFGYKDVVMRWAKDRPDSSEIITGISRVIDTIEEKRKAVDDENTIWYV